MKKLQFEILGNLLNQVFPKQFLKDRRDLLIILLEACRFILQNQPVKHADNLLMLVVEDMSRLFFCMDKKMYSICFPFHVELYPSIQFDLDDIDIDSMMISNLCTVFNSKEFEAKSIYDFVTLLLELEDQFSKDFWRVLKHLLTYEIGYIRYDDDIEGFRTAANVGNSKLHPRYHFDVNLSQQVAFKIGLDKQLTPDKFVEFLDDTKCRKIIKV